MTLRRKQRVFSKKKFVKIILLPTFILAKNLISSQDKEDKEDDLPVNHDPPVKLNQIRDTSSKTSIPRCRLHPDGWFIGLTQDQIVKHLQTTKIARLNGVKPCVSFKSRQSNQVWLMIWYNNDWRQSRNKIIWTNKYICICIPRSKVSASIQLTMNEWMDQVMLKRKKKQLSMSSPRSPWKLLLLTFF